MATKTTTKTKSKRKATRRDERFFEDKALMKQVDELSEEEVKAFEEMDGAIWFDSGLKWTNGAFSDLIIEDTDVTEDDEDNEIEVLVCRARTGVQDERGSRNSEWTLYFNRKTLMFSDNLDGTNEGETW